MLRFLFIFILVIAGSGLLYLGYDLYTTSFSIHTSYRSEPKSEKSETEAVENAEGNAEAESNETATISDVPPSKEQTVKDAVNATLFSPTVEAANDDSENQIAREEKQPSEDELAQDSEKSRLLLGNIQDELSRLPQDTGTAPARSVLLQTASQLLLNEEGAATVHEMAVGELFQPADNQVAGDYDDDYNSAPNKSFNYFLPVLAHEIALKTTDDLGEALGITIDGVMVHRDPSIRFSLVRQFVARYPEFEYDLKEEFMRNNLGLEYFAPTQ